MHLEITKDYIGEYESINDMITNILDINNPVISPMQEYDYSKETNTVGSGNPYGLDWYGIFDLFKRKP